MAISKSSDGAGRTPVDGSGVIQPVSVKDGAGTNLTSTLVGGKQALDVNVTSNTFQSTTFADNGQMFVVATPQTNITPSGTEAAVLLIRNPAASGKTLKIRNIIEGVVSTNKPTTFRVYFNPTVTANGTAQTVRNKHIGHATAPVALASTLPTVTAFGSLLDVAVVVAGVFIVPEDFTLQLPENNSILVSVTPTVNNTEVGITVDWAEV